MVLRFLFLLLLLICYIPKTQASLISASKVTKCIRDGSLTPVTTTGEECKEKFIVTMAVKSSGLGDSNPLSSSPASQPLTDVAPEYIEAELSTTTTDNGDTKTLLNPIKISLLKRGAFLSYPISYVQTVNAKPREEVIYRSLYGCNDGPTQSNPTCGWYLAPNATDAKSPSSRVTDSQGFCCTCNAGQLLGVNPTASRANLNCGKVGGSAQSSASCLRFSDTWYHAYGVGPPQVGFTVSVQYTVTDSAGASNSTEWLELSPSKQISRSSDGSLFAELIGDFAPYKTYLQLNNKFLFVHSPATGPRPAPGTEALLVSESLVSLDGRVCDRVGVGFAAFNSQPSGCSRPIGSCLNGQLQDLIEADLQKRAQGRVGDYLLENYQFNSFEAKVTDKSAFYSQPQILFAVPEASTSLITLTFSADDIRYVVNRSPGKIVDAFALPFEAQSKDGRLVAVVQNIGTLSAEYSISVINCTFAITPIVARSVTLLPTASVTLVFELNSVVAIGRNNSCTVAMYDSQAVLTDSKVVNFTTTTTQVDKGDQQGGNVPNKTVSVPRVVPLYQTVSCLQKCKFYDMFCMLLKGCIGVFFRNLGILAAIILLCCFCCHCCKKGSCLRENCTCCCKSSAGVKSKSEKPRKQPSHQEGVKIYKNIGKSACADSASVHLEMVELPVRRPAVPQPPHIPTPVPAASQTTAGVMLWTEAQLEAVIRSQATVYFHLSLPASSRVIQNVGSWFCLVGRLTFGVSRESPYRFAVDPLHAFQTVFIDSMGYLRQLVPPLQLDPRLLVTDLNLQLAQRHIAHGPESPFSVCFLPPRCDMLKPKVLPQILEQATTNGVTGAVLFKTEGSLLGSAGSEADRAPIVAAIVSNIWSSYEKGGDSNALLIDNEHGKIVVVKISKLLLAVYGGENIDFGILRAKAVALQQYLDEPIKQVAL